MSVYVMKQVQRMPVSIDAAWDFFSHPKNLATITPPKLNLKFTNTLLREETYPGQLITYKVRPLLGIPLFWMTEITHVDKPHYFVDEQRKGPYSVWHHEHHFRAIPGGVEMTDLIHYQLPFGFLGRIGASFVRKQLEDLFAFRREKIIQLLGSLE
ncbi:SRPBCC family protein [Flaviaesturariibacter terrae]